MQIIGELRVLGPQVGNHVIGSALEAGELGQILHEDVAGSEGTYCENWKARTSRTSSIYFQVFCGLRKGSVGWQIWL
jgi:hypothetical protein